ncbi:MAG: hypothetical protein CL535_03120 [Ahrensia sp.]|nr:hypothetical protein [Ahrensia sp.]
MEYRAPVIAVSCSALRGDYTTVCAIAHLPDEKTALIGLNKGDIQMIAFFAMSMMFVTAAFAVPALLPKKAAH